MSIRVRRGLVSVGTCSARSAKCRDMNDDGGLVSLLVRRVRLNVATCSTKSGYCRHVYDEFY